VTFAGYQNLALPLVSPLLRGAKVLRRSGRPRLARDRGGKILGEHICTPRPDRQEPNMTDIETEVTTKISPRPYVDTVSRFQGILDAKGVKVFAVIDQRAEARGVGLDLRDTTLVVFGSPVAGTPVMANAPLAALDLPLKVLIWADNGQVKVSYTPPTELARRYRLSNELATRLAAIDALTDALVAP
jgi:uncharacterized protein (DUF302 family)